MNTYTIRLIIFILLLGYVNDSGAQVRVRRMHKKFESRRDRKIKVTEPAPRKRHSEVTAHIRAVSPSEQRNNMDATFYVKWQRGRQLQYRDFIYNKNLYAKFLPAKDTDLTNVIYPDYREFYKKLNERLNPNNINEDSLWRARAEKLLREKKGGNQGNIVTGFDSMGLFSITVDSPAASVINILPVIYATAENVYYYNITALFSRYDSWMIVKSKDILEHEQIHFDIFELYARKMRRQLIETIQDNYMDGTLHEVSDEIAPVFEQLYQQLNDLQLEFDRQTAALTATNASLTNTNAVWKKGLQQQLAELEKYATAEGTITLN